MGIVLKINMSVLLALLFWGCCLQQIQASSQQPSGNDLFKRAQDGVITIANALSKAYDNSCPESCDMNCSQDLCGPLPDKSSPICFQKARNESVLFNCTNQNQEQSCRSVRVTNDRSSITYVREGGNRQRDATIFQRSALCRTLGLDNTFSQVSNAFGPYFAQYYVGTIDGTLRTFPGREDGSENCLVYDSRKRPWYNGAISYPNHLVILVDRGSTMKEDATVSTSTSPGTRLDYAKVFAASLMETLYVGSYVNFFSFGGGTVDPYKTSIQVLFNFDNPQGHPELESLKSQIRSTNASDSSTEPDEFVMALNTIIKAYDSVESANQNLLRNIILFTDGAFTGNINYTDPSVGAVISEATSRNVTLFIYGMSSNAFVGDSAGLQKLSTTVHGHYQNIQNDPDLRDPLLSMASYSGYLATSHRNLYDNSPFWNRNYKDFFAVGDIVTVATPVFTAGFSFIGVAAIDIILDELGPETGSPMRDDFTAALKQQRDKQNALLSAVSSPAEIPNTFNDSTNCSNAWPGYLCLPGADSGTLFAQRSCCNSCGFDSGINGTSNGNKSLAFIVGPSIGRALLLMILVAGMICGFRKKPSACKQQTRASGERPQQIQLTSSQKGDKNFGYTKLSIGSRNNEGI
ncbi:hypothetical protein R1sor_021975 [Riccia sorocarpa]|uniref:VWFA domain-containing protein n=1 Tax=Riccia sorocarpa TaxID=122646 RepID=A0ABD3GKQ7_9MARC